MPRFFLHLDGEDGRIVDVEGSDLPDSAAAREEALVAARHMWAEAIRRGKDLSRNSIVITDAEGLTIMVLPLIDGLPEGLRNRLTGSS